MAKKGFIKDLNNIEILPITRGELVLDSSGNLAFRSTEFLATNSLPGLMSKEDKAKLDKLNENGDTIDLVSATTDGLAPKIGTAAASTVTTQADEWVLTSTKGATPTWRKLPTNAFLNYYRPILVNGTSLLGNNNTALNIAAGTNINLTTDAGKVTINNGLTKLSDLTDDILSGKYLPLTGGTLTGNLTIGSKSNQDFNYLLLSRLNRGVRINNTDSNAYISFGTLTDANGLTLEKILTFGDSGLRYSPDASTYYNVLHGLNTYIQNGVITINGISITPITSHQSLSNYVTLDTNLTITGAKIFSNDSTHTLVLNGTAVYSTLQFKTPNYVRTFGINKLGNLFITPSNNWNEEYLIWHSGNDGEGSGLDADTIDGLLGKNITIFDSTIDSNDTTKYRHIGYGYKDKGWYENGPALSFGANQSYFALILVKYDGSLIVLRTHNNDKFTDWKQIATTDSNITGNAASADKVKNSLILKINSGSTEGTNKYTYDGSTAKTINIIPKDGIGYGVSAGVLNLTNAGVRSIATGTTDGTISVNTNGTSANVVIKGLDSAAYTSSDSYVRLGYLGSITDVVDLYSKLKPYFGNYCVSITKLKDERGYWGHLLSKFQNPDLGLYGVDGCALFLSGSIVERWYITGKNTTDDPLVYNKYKIYDEGNLGVVSSSTNGLAPKVINTNTAIIGNAYYILASTNGSATPSWYKLPANAFSNTTYTFTNGTYGNFTVTPLGGTAQTVSIGKPATAGTADATVKLQTKRKLWGLDFDGSADVSGNMTGVGVVNSIFEVSKGSGNAKLNVTSISSDRDYLSLYVSSNTSTNTTTRPLVIQHGYGNVGIGVIAPSEKLEVNGNVKATSFIGNLDGNYVNKLTGYTKATSASDLVTTDTLNIALGKLEYKAGIAYSWYRTITEDDTDEIINKWDEVVDFVNNLAIDISEEFVTRKTSLIITGLKNFNTDTNTKPLRISRGGLSTEVVAIGVNDSQAIFEYTNDEKANSYVFKMVNTDTEGSDGSGANTSQVTFTGNSAGSSVTATTFIGKLSNTLTFSAGAFSAKTYNNSLGVTVNIPTHTSHLTNNSGFLTQHLSLANYVTLNTTLTITGQKLFDNQLTIRKDVGSAEASVTDVQHYLQLQVMRKSDAHSVAIGVMPTGTGVIWAKALGIGYNTLYLNPRSNGVAIGCSDLKLPQLNDGYYFHIFGATLSNSTITATKFIKSGGTSSQFLKADGSVDSNKYLINSNSSYTTSYARDININGSNWTFWSPVNSSTSGTVYGPTNAGTKDLVLLSNGSGAPYWTNLSNLKISSLIPTTILSSGSSKFNYVKFASINLTSRYSGMYAILKLTHHFTTSTDYGTSCDLYVHCYQLDPLGTAPRYTIKTNNDDSSFTIVGIINYSSTSSTLDLYVYGKAWTYLSINVLKLAGNNIINIGTNIETLPSGTQVIPLKTGHVEIANSVKNALTFSAGTFATKTYDGSSAITVNIPTKTSHLTNDSGYLTSRGYIGTTAVQASSAVQNLTGIGSISMAGDIAIATNGDTGVRQLRMTGGSNDYGRIAVGATANNAGWIEIATCDDGTEPIYVRQYTGFYETAKNLVTLLDASGHTSIPNNLSVGGKVASSGIDNSLGYGWKSGLNFYCYPTGNNQEWSFDIGSISYANGSNSSYTGCFLQMWSCKNLGPIAEFHNDTRYVNIPIHLYIGGYNNTSYALSTSTFICNSWVRTKGATGWYNEDYGGGWYMNNADYVKVHNGKRVYTSNTSLYAFYTDGGVTAAGFYKVNSSDSYVLLGAGGHKALSDFMLKSEELTNNLTTITKSLTVTADWMDTGIKYTDLATGTYIVQLTTSGTNIGEKANLWSTIWSGVMSWRGSGTNDDDSDEIILHRSGHAYGNTLYLRTIMTANSDGRHLRLLIAANKDLGAAYTYTFKFKRII